MTQNLFCNKSIFMQLMFLKTRELFAYIIAMFRHVFSISAKGKICRDPNNTISAKRNTRET